MSCLDKRVELRRTSSEPQSHLEAKPALSSEIKNSSGNCLLRRSIDLEEGSFSHKLSDFFCSRWSRPLLADTNSAGLKHFHVCSQ